MVRSFRDVAMLHVHRPIDAGEGLMMRKGVGINFTLVLFCTFSLSLPPSLPLSSRISRLALSLLFGVGMFGSSYDANACYNYLAEILPK